MSKIARLLLTVVFASGLFVHADATKSAGQSFLDSCQKAVTTGAPVKLNEEKSNPMIEALKDFLKSEIIGQEPGVDALAEAIEMIGAFLNDPDKPMARYFFLGPTGVGKTELVRALVRYFKGNPDKNMIRFDGGELQFDHEISKIIGTTAGYKGYGDKPGLHPENVDGVKITMKMDDGTTTEFTIILFDEIEKASPAVRKMLLGILDNGLVTLGDNTRSVLRKTMIIATSNLGAKEVERLIDARKMAIEAKKAANAPLSEKDLDLTGRKDEEFRKSIFDTYMKAILAEFAPEFKMRWHKFIQFLHLERPHFLKIADVMLSKVQKRIFQRAKTKFAFELTDKAKAFLVDKGTDFRNGSRELGNLIEFEIVRKFSRLLATNEIANGDVVSVDVEGEGDQAKFSFHKINGSSLDEAQLKGFADATFPGKKMKDVVFKTGDQEAIEDRVTLVKSLLKSAHELPVAMSNFWLTAEKSKAKTESLKVAGGPNQPHGFDQTDTITYKIVSVDGVLVRLQYSALAVQELRKKDPNAEYPIHAEVIEKMSQDDQLDYQGAGLHVYSADWLRDLIFKIRARDNKAQEEKK